jgi:class 3 adenylate cyclase/tetratricopeptide (TPR) repeat protein
LSYIATDRRHALAAGVDLPRRTAGAALFADISGFTSLTEALVTAMGPARGAEELSVHLNRVYDALVQQVDDYRGSVLAFSGDAITCWFDDSGDGGWTASREPPMAVQRAVACGLGMQSAMQPFGSIAVKVAVAVGPVSRFVVGDAEIQKIDALAGSTLSRLAAAEHHADPGDVVVDKAAATALGEPFNIHEWREDSATGERFASLSGLSAVVSPDPWPQVAVDRLPAETVRPWLLPPVASRLDAGLGDFLTELRPAVSLFLRFGGIDYDEDPEAEAKLDEFVRATQRTLQRFDSYILQLTMGDKGSYLNAAFGAPVAHEDDAERAVMAALELRDGRPPWIGAVQIGIGLGHMRTGAYGASTRRTYGVLGDAVNVAARLMQHAPADAALVDPSVHHATSAAFVWEDVGSIRVKGKSDPVPASRLVTGGARPSLGASEPTDAMPMVGRETELAVITARLDQLVTGAGAIVGITGEAGIGKTRLLTEVITRARRRSIPCFGGECQSYGLNVSYLVWRSVFRAFFDLDSIRSTSEQIEIIEAKLAATDAALVGRVPLLAPVLNIPIPDNELTMLFDAKLRKESLEAMLVDVIRARASETPLLLVLEDCHWLDHLSHELLHVIGRAVADLPVLIVVTSRPPDTSGSAAPTVSQLSHYTHVPLADLADTEIASLVHAKLHELFGADVDTPSERLAVEIGRRAERNPFYIGELLNFLKDRGISPLDASAVEQAELPDSLSSLILGRIDQLTEEQRTILKVASVIGPLFDVDMVSRIYQPFDQQDRLRSNLGTLADLQLIVPERPEPRPAYLFKHVLTQQVTYSTLTYATRAVLHEQVAHDVEAHNDVAEQDLDFLAYHYDRSTNIDKRREYLIKAGQSARASFANITAIDYFQRALAVLDGDDRVQALFPLGEVHELVGDFSDAASVIIEAREIAKRRDDISGVARAELALAVIDRKRGNFDSASSCIARARAGFEAADDVGGVSRALAELGLVAQLQGDLPQARARYEQSLLHADRIGEPIARQSARAQALKGAATVAAMEGEYEAAQGLYDESLIIRRELGDTPGVAALLNNQGVLARYRQDLIEARRLNDESIALFRTLGDRWSLGQLLNNQACVAADQGHFAEARTLLAESLNIRRQLGDRDGLALSLTTLADVAIDEGDYAGSMPLLEESLAVYRSLGEATGVLYVIEDYALVAAAQGLYERALRLESFASTRRQQLGTPLAPAEAARVARMVSPAHAALDPATVERCVREGRNLGLADTLDELLAMS